MQPARSPFDVDHARRLVVTADTVGWEVREEEDSVVVSRVHRSDWHRVERDILMFDMRARKLDGQSETTH